MLLFLLSEFWQDAREGVEEGAYAFSFNEGNNLLGGTDNRREVTWDCLVS